MSVAIAPLVRDIEARARRDADFVALLDDLLDAPTDAAGTLRRGAANRLNESRRASVRAEFLDGALSTAQVQALLGYSSPQAVHRLRSRRRLLGVALGNQTWFPGWQLAGGRLRADLPRVLELLGRYTADAVAADRIMRLARDELDGGCLADALDDPGTADRAWRLLAALGA